MKVGRYVYPIAVVLAIAVGFGMWQPKAVKADSHHEEQPSWTVDPSWPQPLPAPVGTDGVAHRWVTGEVAGTCIDSNDHIFTVNRGWEVGVTIGGVLQGNESGAIVGQDASASAIPSPPVVAYNQAGYVVDSFGDPSLVQTGPTLWRGGSPAPGHARLLRGLPGQRLDRRQWRRHCAEVFTERHHC